MILRTIKCGICGFEATETQANKGWKGWGQLSGAALDGDANPHLCPDHVSTMFTHADHIKQFLTKSPQPVGPENEDAGKY